jgi:DNA replication protein DnaC
MKLPPLPSTIRPLNDEDSIRVNALGSHSMAECLTCRGKKKFSWYIYASGREDTKEVVEYDCPCEDQWLLHRVLLASGILVKYQRFSSWDFRYAQPYQILSDYVEKFDSYFTNGIGLVLRGPSGNGKSLVSALIAKHVIRNGRTAYFSTFQDLLQSLAAGWRDDDARDWIIKKAKKSSLLVIDDIGKEMMSGLEKQSSNIARSAIDDILRYRVGMSMPTIVTTNSPLDDIAKGYGISTLSLLSESCIHHNFGESDFRPKERERMVIESDKGLTRPVVL